MTSLLSRVCAAWVTALLAMTWGGAAAHGVPMPGRNDDGRWVWPLDPLPRVVEPFDAPDSAWAAGHRGVDLLGSQGQPVRAIGAGVVSFAGVVAGRGVVSVRHGALRSTYEPVTASLSVGTTVSAGQVIGLLQSVRSHCAPAACLHLGVRRGDTYLDPLSLLGPRQVRLKPLTVDDRSTLPVLPPQPVRRAVGIGSLAPLVVVRDLFGLISTLGQARG